MLKIFITFKVKSMNNLCDSHISMEEEEKKEWNKKDADQIFLFRDFFFLVCLGFEPQVLPILCLIN